MKLEQLVQMVEGKAIVGNSQLELDIEFGFSSDLMSDVLRLRHDKLVLITGLANLQTIRTAEMSDISCVIFVRGKQISDEMISLAEENGIVLISCKESMFKVSGILYKAGIKPVF